MKRMGRIALACIGAFAAGLAFGGMIVAFRPGAGGPDPGSGEGAEELRSFDETLRDHPERILGDLSRDPFLTLSPDECDRLARGLDPTRQGTWRLLNAVASPDLRGRLWEACLRAKVDELPLEELVRIAGQAHPTTRRRAYLPVYETVEASGKAGEILATDWGKEALLAGYVRYFAAKNSHLEAALALIPADRESVELKSEVVVNWDQGEPKVEDFPRVLEISQSEGGGPNLWAHAAGGVWRSASAADRARLLDDLSGLPCNQRDRVLSTIGASYVAAEDVPGIVSILGRLGSLETQEHVVREWLGKAPEEGREQLLDAIRHAPDPSRFRKLAAGLVSDSEGN